MQNLSSSKQAALQKAQSYWQRANTHPSILQWRAEAVENFGFYDGSGQWLETDRARVQERGQKPLTFNVIQGRVDSLSGMEIQSRYRVSCQNDSGNPEEDRLAEALTHYLFFIQKNQKVPYKGSLKFRDMLICGLGWSNVYKEKGRTFYDYVHPFNVIPDPDDLSPQYDSMKYVCRKRWMEPDMVRKIWPKVASYIDFDDPDIAQSVDSPELTDRNSSYTSINNYVGYAQTRVLVGEVQYKEAKKAYSGIDYQGHYFETFDEEKAELLANSPRDIIEIDSYRIKRTLFLDSYLLEDAPLDPDLPGTQDFTYIPCVWKKRFRSGVPYGLLEGMKDAQRDLNVRMTKALYLANSSRLIVKGPLPLGYTSTQLSEELKKPDSVLLLPQNTDYELKDNAPLSEAQLRLMQEYDVFIQKTSGIYDDFLGKETNASSAVAQRQRQINSARNNVFAFDSFADMKEREARAILTYVQGSDEENLLVQILTDEERSSIILNLSRTINGKTLVFNDIRTLPISLEIEEVPDFSSTAEENKVALQELLSNPNAMFIMQSPSLLRRIGIRDYEKVAAEIQKSFMQQQEPQPANAPAVNASNEDLMAEQQNMVYPGI